MKEMALNFILNSKVDSSRIEQIAKDNNISRNVFADLYLTAKDFFEHKSRARMLALTGMRGVGKTTLMWELAKKIYEQYTQTIYFFNITTFSQAFGDNNLYSLFDSFQTNVLKKKFYELEHPIVLLFDEVHEALHWDKGLKTLYEECPKAFVVCTGSSALLLNSSADLAQRWDIIRVFPYNFSEFVPAILRKENYEKLYKIVENEESNLENYVKTIHNLKEIVREISESINSKNALSKKLKDILFYSEDLNELEKNIKNIKNKITSYFSKISSCFGSSKLQEILVEYISYYNIPRLVDIGNIDKILERAIGMFDEIMEKDVSTWIGNENKENVKLKTEIGTIKKMLYLFADKMDVNLDDIGSGINCKKNQLENYIHALEKAEVLNTFLPYGHNKPKVTKNKKIFFMSPTLRLALYGSIFGYKMSTHLQAMLYEEIVAMYLKRLFPKGPVSCSFFEEENSENKKHPDFIIGTQTENNNKPVILEVKTSKTNAQQISKSGIDYRYGILVTAKADDFSISGNIIVLPLSWFLLL